MQSFDLPSIRPDAAPSFTDSSGCAKWLQTLTLINIVPAHGKLLAELKELNGCSIVPAERLKIMELLREPVTFVQKEYAKKFASRPAPLAKPERDVFQSVIALWDALADGYRHGLQAVAGGASGMNVALLCQRVLWCTGQKLVALYEVYRDIDARDWEALHRAYGFAEEKGVGTQDAAHPVRKGKQTTCAETYAQILLLDLASPSKLTARQIELISGWLEYWADKVSFTRTRGTAEEAVSPLAVDLASGAGASRRSEQGDAVRYLDLGDIGKSLRRRVSLLRKGESPASLGLGEDVTATLAESLLVMLYRRWCEDKQSRAMPRRSVAGTAKICSGMAAIHYFVTGRPFRPRGGTRELSKAEHEQIATLGRIATHRENDAAPAADFASEDWQMKDESASGLRLERSDPNAGSRLVVGQLLGIRPPDAKGYLLCTVRWLSVSAQFDLCIGVQILPGVPVGIAIRPPGGAAEPAQALLLPAMVALKTPDTLVLPAGWFKPQRAVEILGDAVLQVQLASVIDRGADFERVTFDRA
jgi:cyclic-di-GMP-binding protein